MVDANVIIKLNYSTSSHYEKRELKIAVIEFLYCKHEVDFLKMKYAVHCFAVQLNNKTVSGDLLIVVV